MRKIQMGMTGCVPLAALVLAGCGNGTAGAEEDERTVTMAVQGVSRSNVPFMVADQEGFFADHDIVFEAVPIEGGGGPVIAAMASGSVDVILQAVNVVGGANQQGQDLKFFCGNSSDHNWTILSRPDSGIASFDETQDWTEVMASLEGKTFGIPGRGASLEAFMYGLLEEAGVDTESIDFRAIGFGDPARVAFQADQVDAMMGYPFLSSQLVRSGEADLALDLASDGPESFRDLFVDGFVAEAGWLEENQEVADDFCASLHDANAWIMDEGNHDGLAELFRKEFALEDDQVIADAISGMEVMTTQVPEANMTTAIDFAVATGQLEAEPAITFDDIVAPVPSAR